MKVAWCRFSLVALSGCMLALGACGKSRDTRTEPQPGPEIAGRTGQLQKNPSPPAHNLEQVGTDARAWEKQEFHVRAGDRIPINGWAIDLSTKKAAQGVEVSLDGVPHVARYGIERPDVATAFASPSCLKTGYSLEIDGSKLPKGRTTMTIRIISADGSFYQESTPYFILVE